MSCHRCESIPDLLALLQELKSELSGVETKCAGIQQEILESSNQSEVTPTALMETTVTLKQIVEKTACDLELLRKRLNEQEESQSPPGTKVQRIEQSSKENDKDEQTPSTIVKVMKMLIPKDIIVKTMDEEIDLLKTELEAVMYDRKLVKGKSFGGKPPAEIASSFATSERPFTLAIVINNFLNERVLITNTWTFPYYDNVIGVSPTEIVEGQNEILKFGSAGRTVGLIELTIGTSDTRLIILGYNLAGTVADARVFLTTDTNIQLNMHLCVYLTSISRQTSEGSEVFTKIGDIRVRSASAVGAHSIASIDIGSVQGLVNCCTRLALAPPSLDFFVKPRLMSNECVASVLTTISQSQSHGCMIRIGNGLPVNMEELLILLEPRVGRTIPHGVRTKTLGYGIAHDTKKFEGMVSYRLCETDLRLTIGFRLGEGENELAMGFFPLEVLPCSSLLKFLFEDHPYLSRLDQIHGKASDGTLRVIRRNIVAEAKMTSNERAVLEVLITTY